MSIVGKYVINKINMMKKEKMQKNAKNERVVNQPFKTQKRIQRKIRSKFINIT